MAINTILKKIKIKYLKDENFRKEFDKDREKAIEKYFGKNFLNDLKKNFGNISAFNSKSFLNSREELDDNSLEAIAGGKNEKPKNQTTIVTIEEEYKQTNFDLGLKDTRTGGNVTFIDNSTLHKL